MLTPQRAERIETVARRRQPGVIVLEDVHDPHNAAAVLRTCDAFGIQQVHFVFVQSTPYDPRQVGKVSSSSANKWLDFTIHDSTSACLSHLRDAGYEQIASVIVEGGESLWEADLTRRPPALWFGNEHRGLSREAVEGADRRVSIPMRGMVESLNISVTAAIFVFELTRQRQAQGGVSLPEPEIARLIESFKDRAS